MSCAKPRRQRRGKTKVHNIRRIAAPVSEVLLVAQVKQHARIDTNSDDAYIAELIEAAVSYTDGYEGILGKALITQTWAANLDAFEDFYLPLGPNASVQSIQYYDAQNVQQSFAGFEQRDLKISLSDGASWPGVYSRADAVTITWTAGYGDGWNDVPMSIRIGLMHIVAAWYENRESVGQSSPELPTMGMKILMANRAAGYA